MTFYLQFKLFKHFDNPPGLGADGGATHDDSHGYGFQDFLLGRSGGNSVLRLSLDTSGAPCLKSAGKGDESLGLETKRTVFL